MKRREGECNEVEWHGVGWRGVGWCVDWVGVERSGGNGEWSGCEWTGAVVWRKGEGSAVSAVQCSRAPTPTVRSNAFMHAA